MTTVKCPICRDKVSGANTADLNENLREHLADTHQMRELSMGREGMAREPSSERYVYTERPREREYVREERREPQGGQMERLRERAEPGERREYEAREAPYYERRPAAGMFSAPESRTIREVETWTSRDPERFRSEYYIPRESVRQWRYPVTGPSGERGPTSSERLREGLREQEERTESYERRGGMMERRESEEIATISCPMCGQLIRGRDEDDLSDELRDHMKGSHDIKPKMTARFQS